MSKLDRSIDNKSSRLDRLQEAPDTQVEELLVHFLIKFTIFFHKHAN